MYIKVRNNTHVISNWFSSQGRHIITGVLGGMSLPIENQIDICTTITNPDGVEFEFVLNTLEPNLFPYQTLENDVLILSSFPALENTEEPEPIEPPVDELTFLRLAIAELAEAQSEEIVNLQLAIAELAETLLGGE